MMKKETWMTIGLMALACGGNGGASAGAAEYRLQEHLDYNWPRQLIAFEAAFEPGTGRDITSVTADGEPVHFQAPQADVERHPDGSLARTRVYVFTDLGARQTIVFRAHLDGERPELEPLDLQVSEDNGLVTLETAAGAGVRLPLGTFTGEDIPAPYQGFRLTTGQWTGRSRLMGEPGPEGLTAAVTERGPIFAEVRLRYAYPEGRSHTLRCRVIAGEAVALFTEDFDTEPGSRYHHPHRNQPTRFAQNRYGLSEAFEKSHWVRIDLNDFQPDLHALEQAPDKQSHANIDASDPWLATLHPWQSWHGGTHLLALHNDADYLGLMTLRAGQWRRPLENLILLKQKEVSGAFLQVPINDGARAWGLHFGTPDSGRPRAEGPYPHTTTISALRRARITYGETSLDTVKDWTLSWQDETAVPNPVSVYPRGDLEAAHARFRNLPELADVAREVVGQWERNWSGKTEDDLGPPDFGGERGIRPRVSDVAPLYLATGKEEHARHQVLLARAKLDFYIHQTLNGAGHTGMHWGHNFGMWHIAMAVYTASQMADPLLGSPHVTAEQKRQLRARLAFYAHLLTDPDYWPESDDIAKGGPGSVSRHHGAVGTLGTVLAGHPRAREWQAIGMRMVEYALNEQVLDDGVATWGTTSGMHYAGVAIDTLLPFMAMLVNAGGVNYFEHEAFQRAMRWYAAMCPPPDARFGRAYMPPYGYSHPMNTSQSARWAVAAAMTYKSAPDFAALMMDTWRRQGRLYTLQFSGRAAIGMIDPSLLPDRPPVRPSARWGNFGAVLRAHSETDRETYMSICDWGGWANESAGFHMYAKGAPMSVIFGARSYFDPVAYHSAFMVNRVVVDQREEDGGPGWRGTRRFRTGEHTWASLPTADLFGTQFRFTRLQGRAMVFEGDEEDPGNLELSERRPWPKGAPPPEQIIRGNVQSRFGEIEEVPPQTWQRRVMLVKDEDPLGPNYFLVRDSLAGTLPTEWNLWVMSEALPDIEGQRARFRGTFDVDLDVYFAESPSNIVTGAWGPGEGAHRTWHIGYERQRLLQLQRDANQDYLVVLYPHTEGEEMPEFSAFGAGRGVRLKWAERTDHLVLSDETVEVEADSLRFAGEAGFTQRGEGWTRLTLLVGDTIGLDGFLLTQRGKEEEEAGGGAGEDSVSVTAMAAPERRIAGEAMGGPREVVIRVPAAYAGLAELRINGEPAPLRAEGDDVYSFRLPAGRHGFEIQ